MNEFEELGKSIDPLMREALKKKVFPGAVLLVSKQGKIVFHRPYGHANIFSKRPVTLETLFDLASLTKPLATSLAVMKLVNDNRLDLGQSLGGLLDEFKNSDKENINIRQLLTHSSGLPDYRPFYQELNKYPQRNRRAILRNFLVGEPLVYPPGEDVKYSDLGFMILAWIVEHVSGSPLDKFVSKNVYEKLGLQSLFFRDRKIKMNGACFAATEKCPWRKKVLEGEVHDGNAFVVGGIDGQAGLFGTAMEIFRLLDYLSGILENRIQSTIFKKKLVFPLFSRYGETNRTFGFDTPSKVGSSAGGLFSHNSVGHLGFTGTSFWMDLDRSIQVILLANRVHPSLNNEKIRVFRPVIHDRIMEKLIN